VRGKEGRGRKWPDKKRLSSKVPIMELGWFPTLKPQVTLLFRTDSKHCIIILLLSCLVYIRPSGDPKVDMPGSPKDGAPSSYQVAVFLLGAACF
jgi:hypothetical protein